MFIRQALQNSQNQPETQNGIVCLVSQPAYPVPKPAAEIARRLIQTLAHPQHQFWADSINLLDRSVFNLAKPSMLI